MLFWLIKFLPDLLVHAMFCVGVLGFIASYFIYKLPLRIAGLVLIAFGLFFEGCVLNRDEWEKKVSEAEARVKVSESNSANINNTIQTKTITQTKIIKVKGDDVIKYIDHYITTQVDNTCKIPDVVIKAHNDAALNIKPEQEQPK